MSDDAYPNLPSQKELEKELANYLSKKYGERVKIVSTGLFPLTQKDESPDEEKKSAPKFVFDFNVKPEELVAFLDEYVVQQQEAKDILATKICTHFNRIRYALERPGQADRGVGHVKTNVLLIGPTGVGKTYLIKLIAQHLGVPFVKGDATKFSETGYVGGDVEDLVRDLLRQTDGDIERAQHGIIYVDEIDKIAATHYKLGADVSRTGVQRALLKPMEETEVELKVAHDPISQIEAIEQYRTTGKREKRIINTKNILFIMSGAFADLAEIAKKRLQKQSIGFEGTISSKKDVNIFLKQVKAEDLIQYGFESEFVGRLPVLAVLDELTGDDLYDILRNAKSSVVIGKKQDFLAYGIKVQFEDEALKEIAQKAIREQTGARGLLSVMEKTLLPFEKKLPSTDITYLAVTVDVVRNPHEELTRLLNRPEQQEFHRNRYDELAQVEMNRLKESIQNTLGEYMEEHGMLSTPERLIMMARECQEKNMDSRDICDIFIKLVRQAHEFAETLTKKCGLKVTFNEEAIDRILAKEPRTVENIKAFCATLLNTFEYGLTLMSQKKGTEHIVITGHGIDAPEHFINGLVGEAFKPE